MYPSAHELHARRRCSDDPASAALPRATGADYMAAAAHLGPVARELHAVIAVESSGSGFYADGRLKMLFEPHRFRANLSGP